VTTVGIRELKAKLSDYVERAHGGEQIIVTAHGARVAILAPLPADLMALDDLVATGRARWNGGKPKGLPGIRHKGKLISDTVLEDREP
jgi:prevent-host-death family protein